jgi:hypothetical protein
VTLKARSGPVRTERSYTREQMNLIASVVGLLVRAAGVIGCTRGVPHEKIARAGTPLPVARRMMSIDGRIPDGLAAASVDACSRESDRERMSRRLRIDFTRVSVPEIILAHADDAVVATIDHDVLPVLREIELENAGRVREPEEQHLSCLELAYELASFALREL